MCSQEIDDFFYVAAKVKYLLRVITIYTLYRIFSFSLHLRLDMYNITKNRPQTVKVY